MTAHFTLDEQKGRKQKCDVKYIPFYRSKNLQKIILQVVVKILNRSIVLNLFLESCVFS